MNLVLNLESHTKKSSLKPIKVTEEFPLTGEQGKRKE